MGRETNKQRREATAQSAREKAAASRALQQRADQRRRAIAVISSIVVVAVILAVIAIVVLNKKSKSGPATAASDTIVSEVTGVPTAVTAATGAGATLQAGAPQTISGTALDASGKPTLLFIGGEFCPYCAAQRWALVESLSRFGTFTGLKQIKSSEDKISTFTFVGSTYTSKYLNFDAKEAADQNRAQLQKLTTTENTQWNKYLAPNESQPGFPFLDFNGKYVSISPMIDPQVLIGKTWSQIAGSLKDTSSPIAQAVNGAANTTTSAICQMTGDKPASVCTPAITALSQKFTAYQAS